MSEYTTSSRTKILDYLKSNCTRAVNANDIAQYLRTQNSEVNITTIYRYLDKLEKEGTILKYVAQKGDRAVYQYVELGHNCEEHLHLRCSQCGGIVHLECDFMDEIYEHILAHHGFCLSCKDSILTGICKNCQKNNS